MGKRRAPATTGNITAGTAVTGNNMFNAPVYIGADPALIAEIKVRLEAVEKGTSLALTIKTTGNLAAAKVSTNRFFTGRVDELARLHAALTAGSVAIVHALAGEGGIGKTELAKAYALIFAAEYDGVWWIDASANALSTELAAVYRLATGTDVPQGASVPDLCQALADCWASEKHLVVLDNVDDEANFVLFGGMAKGRVLATTRELVKTLAGVTPFRVEVLPTADAVSLMRKEIAGNRADVSDADLTAIAQELGGHALAVALAGAYLANYADIPASVVLAKLRTSGVGDIEPVGDEAKHDALGLAYPRSVAASLALHFEKKDVKLAMPVLAAAAFLHPTGITVEWLAEGTGQSVEDVRKALKTLAKHSILKYEATISVHRLTQGVARAWLAKAEPGGAARVLAGWFRAISKLHEGDDHDEVRPKRTAAAVHVAAAADHALQDSTVAVTHHGAADCHLKNARHYLIIGDLASAESAINKAVRWADGQGADSTKILMVFLASRARMRQNRGDLVRAEADLKRSIDWGESQTPRYERNLAIDYASRASIRLARGDLVRAEDDLKRSIDWGESQTPRDERSLSIWYASRASIRLARGDLARAEDDLKRSIDWGKSQTPRNERGLSICYASRAGIRLARGDLVRAEADLKRSIDWGESQTPRDERSLAILYAYRARIRHDQAVASREAGEASTAAALFAQAKTDIAGALAWYEANLPGDERTIGGMRETKARIEKAERGER